MAGHREVVLSKGQSKPVQSPTLGTDSDAPATPAANYHQADHMNYSAQQHTGNQSCSTHVCIWNLKFGLDSVFSWSRTARTWTWTQVDGSRLGLGSLGQ